MHKNRIVIVGLDFTEAHQFARTDRFKDELESPVVVATSSYPSTIRGSLAGMHVGTVYITPRATEGPQYAVVEEALKHAKGKNPDMKTVFESLVSR